MFMLKQGPLPSSLESVTFSCKLWYHHYCFFWVLAILYSSLESPIGPPWVYCCFTGYYNLLLWAKANLLLFAKWLSLCIKVWVPNEQDSLERTGRECCSIFWVPLCQRKACYTSLSQIAVAFLTLSAF